MIPASLKTENGALGVKALFQDTWGTRRFAIGDHVTKVGVGVPWEESDENDLSAFCGR